MKYITFNQFNALLNYSPIITNNPCEGLPSDLRCEPSIKELIEKYYHHFTNREEALRLSKLYISKLEQEFVKYGDE